MEFNYGVSTQTEKSMSETVLQLYAKICKVLSIQCKLNKISMIKMQSMGYNGFKRWHRYRTRQFYELKLCLMNELYDKFRLVPEFNDYELTYSPKDMEEHLKSWDKAVLDAIQELGTYNKEYYDLTGMQCEIIKCAIHKLTRDYEKIGRCLKRFTESDWLSLDMHIYDDRIHEKYKCKEEEHGYKY